MKCFSALSRTKDTAEALKDVSSRVKAGLGSDQVDLAVVFSSIHHAPKLKLVVDAIHGSGFARHLVGCTGESIIGENEEVEGESALALWAIQFSGVTVTPRRLLIDENRLSGWESAADSKSSLIVLGDPFSFPTDPFLKKMAEIAPGVRIVGGMASASQRPGGNRLLLDGDLYDQGSVAIELSGPVMLRTVVSQGCRPIGRTFIVTRAEQNVIRELGRRPALEVLREVFEELDEDDQERVKEGLHIGRVINEYQETFERGDFLVRNVMGFDEAGGIAITDLIRVGQTVQFQVRDADSADEDLRTLIENERLARPSEKICGALLFSCNGRGTRLFPTPNHDVEAVHKFLGPVPVAGFFAMGELGPVGGQNFIHGFTASVVLFEEV